MIRKYMCISLDNTFNVKIKNVKVVCKGAQCMFSCGLTGDKRKQNIEDLVAGTCLTEDKYCVDENAGAGKNSSIFQNFCKEGDNTDIFIDLRMHIATVAFIGLGMIFAIISGTLALYNTYRTPIQPVLSILGLYAWNSVAAVFVLLAMIMWTVEFSTRLRKNAAVSDTLSGEHDSSGTGSLGFSFWILILAICFAIANIVIIKFRSWKIIKMEEKNVRVMTDKLESGDILLF